MNKIEKSTQGDYKLTCENGEEFICKRWFEKKTDSWHVVLPKNNPSGRTYVRESNFDNKDIYEFETKTTHREGLSSGGWKSKLTLEESNRLNELEQEIEELKKEALSRKPIKIDPNSEEGIQLQIDKLKAKLDSKRSK